MRELGLQVGEFGFYAVIAKLNLIKKLIGLSLFQAAVFLLYITMGNVEGASAPIFGYGAETFSNPLPQVLILTAIVVGISTMALGLGLVVGRRVHQDRPLFDVARAR